MARFHSVHCESPPVRSKASQQASDICSELLRSFQARLQVSSLSWKGNTRVVSAALHATHTVLLKSLLAPAREYYRRKDREEELERISLNLKVPQP